MKDHYEQLNTLNDAVLTEILPISFLLEMFAKKNYKLDAHTLVTPANA